MTWSGTPCKHCEGEHDVEQCPHKETDNKLLCDLLDESNSTKAIIEEARKSGIVVYSEDVPTIDMVDPLIWPAVEKINESGWVWTAESCQGHVDYDGDLMPAWANTDPFLRLFCREMDIGRLFDCLMKSSKYFIEEVLEGFLSYRIYPSKLNEWFEVLVYVPSMNVRDRRFGIEGFERFAEFANEPGGGQYL